MKISPKMKRTLSIFLTVTTIYGFGIDANSELQFVPGLALARDKITSCHHIVTDIPTHPAANDDERRIVLSSLERALKRIQFAVGNVDANGKIISKISPAFSDVYYSGYARKMSSKMANTVIGRLNGAVENLDQQD